MRVPRAQVFLYPRIIRTKAAREVLESDQSARFEAVQRRLRLLVGIRGGLKTSVADGDEGEVAVVAKDSTKVDESGLSTEEAATSTGEKVVGDDLLANDSTALARTDSRSPEGVDQDLFALPESVLLDLSGALPLLAPRPRPGGLLRSLSTVSRTWTSASLSFSAKTYVRPLHFLCRLTSFRS